MAVNIPLISTWDSKGVRAAQKELDDFAKHTKTTTQKISDASKLGFATLSGIVGGVGTFAVNATSKLEDANAQLENAFKNAGTSMDAQKGKLANAQAQLSKFGYSNSDSAEAIGRLTTVTGSADKAFGSIGLAADIAKNRHIELSKAGDLLAKTMGGNMTAAKRMGVTIPESIQKLKDPTEKANAIMAILQDRFKGSADAAAGTFKGKMEVAKAQATNMAAAIGTKLVPMVLSIVDALMKVANWISKHKEVMIGIVVAIGAALLVMAGFWIYNTIVAMTFWTAATGGIILLVGALAAGIAWIVLHWGAIWGWIKKTVTGVWHHIINAFHAVIDWLGRNWPMILAIITGPIGLAVLFIIRHWQTILNFIKSVPKKIGGFLGKVGEVIKTAFANVVDFVTSPFKAAFNLIAKLWNNTVGKLRFQIPSWVPGVGGKGFDVPNIPTFKAAGGNVSSMTPYIVGEQGPELFVPGRSGTIVPNGSLGGGTVIQNITITSNDPQQVVNALVKYQQRNGSVPIKVA